MSEIHHYQTEGTYKALKEYKDASEVAQYLLSAYFAETPLIPDPVLEGRQRFIAKLLSREHMHIDSDQAPTLRGELMEIVAHKACASIAQKKEGYYYLPAPPQYFDLSQKESKGGDHLLVKVTPEKREIIAIIDTTTRSKSDSALKSGAYKGLSEPIPVILLEFEGMRWKTERGETEDTKHFLHHTVRRHVIENDEGFLFGADQQAASDVMAEIKRRISVGCRRTRQRLQGQQFSREELELLLEKIAIAEHVLGLPMRS